MKKILLVALAISAPAVKAAEEWTERVQMSEDSKTGEKTTRSKGFVYTGKKLDCFEQDALRRAGYEWKMVEERVQPQAIWGGVAGFLGGALAGCFLKDKVDCIQKHRIAKVVTMAATSIAGAAGGAYIFGKMLPERERNRIEEKYLMPSKYKCGQSEYGVARDLRQLLAKDLELNRDVWLEGNPAYYFNDGQCLHYDVKGYVRAQVLKSFYGQNSGYKWWAAQTTLLHPDGTLVYPQFTAVPKFVERRLRNEDYLEAQVLYQDGTTAPWVYEKRTY